jgi:hypothetical protein
LDGKVENQVVKDELDEHLKNLLYSMVAAFEKMR